MARLPRIHSQSGYFHITVRGVGKQILFEEKSDYLRYLHLLKRFSIETKVNICAYCLMENHVHLLVYDRGENLALFMKKLGVAYSYYFNQKYERTGHLFQGRYVSVPIESDDFLLTVFRYILNNPRKAGICSAADYPWSSYRKYGNQNSFVDTMVLQEMLGSFEEYAAFIDAKYDDEEFETPNDAVQNDEWAIEIIRKTLNIESGTVLQSYVRQRRDQALRILKEKGLTIRQIERLTGISKSVIQRA